MIVLFFGDVVGSPGRNGLKRLLPRLITQHRADLVVANIENIAGGAGVTVETTEEMLAAEVDFCTSGNHIWSKKEIVPYLDRPGCKLIRPANYPDPAPGRGWGVVETADGRKLGVVNVEGRAFMRNLDDPFRAADRELARLRDMGVKLVLVDVHCDATSEKQAMGWHLDGRAAAVVGTHTHVQTADERVLTQGTAFITDVGMCGPEDSVIGVRKELAIQRFLTQRPVGFEPAKKNVVVQGVVLDLDEQSGRARSIARIREFPGD
jgi:hypothetical protein